MNGNSESMARAIAAWEEFSRTYMEYKKAIEDERASQEASDLTQAQLLQDKNIRESRDIEAETALGTLVNALAEIGITLPLPL